MSHQEKPSCFLVCSGTRMACDIGHRLGGAGVPKRIKHVEVLLASRGPIKKLGASDELFSRCRQPATVAPHYRPGPSCILLCSATGVGIFELRCLRCARANALSDVAVCTTADCRVSAWPLPQRETLAANASLFGPDTATINSKLTMNVVKFPVNWLFNGY
jgi:hypothetical protein